MSCLDASQKWKLRLWLRCGQSEHYLTPFRAGLNRAAIKQANLPPFSKVLTIIISCQGVNRHKHDYIYSCKYHLSLPIWQVSKCKSYCEFYLHIFSSACGVCLFSLPHSISVLQWDSKYLHGSHNVARKRWSPGPQSQIKPVITGPVLMYTVWGYVPCSNTEVLLVYSGSQTQHLPFLLFFCKDGSRTAAKLAQQQKEQKGWWFMVSPLGLSNFLSSSWHLRERGERPIAGNTIPGNT